MLTLELPRGVDEARARLLLAISLFREDGLSLGRAATLAGLSYRDFADALAEQGIPLTTYTDDALREDLAFSRDFVPGV